jgi:hypothetical protein
VAKLCSNFAQLQEHGEQLFAHYNHLDEDLKAELPLKRIWTVASQEDE